MNFYASRALYIPTVFATISPRNVECQEERGGGDVAGCRNTGEGNRRVRADLCQVLSVILRCGIGFGCFVGLVLLDGVC